MFQKFFETYPSGCTWPFYIFFVSILFIQKRRLRLFLVILIFTRRANVSTFLKIILSEAPWSITSRLADFMSVFNRFDAFILLSPKMTGEQEQEEQELDETFCNAHISNVL